MSLSDRIGLTERIKKIKLKISYYKWKLAHYLGICQECDTLGGIVYYASEGKFLCDKCAIALIHQKARSA